MKDLEAGAIKAPAASAAIPKESPGPGALDISPGLLKLGLGLSLLCNVCSLAYVLYQQQQQTFQEDTAAALGVAGDGALGAVAQAEASGRISLDSWANGTASLPIRLGQIFQVGDGKGTGPALDRTSFDEQLRRAHITYKRNQQRRKTMVGTGDELTMPFEGEAWELWKKLRPEAYKEVHFLEYELYPTYPCTEEERVGTWGDGGKWVCFQGLHKQDLVFYSIGCNGETSFEREMAELFGTKVHTFDPFLTPEQIAAVGELPYLIFHDFGLSVDGTQSAQDTGKGLQKAAKDIQTIMRELGHSFVDVFKVDCEGCELGFVDILSKTVKREEPIFGQIQMEIHNAKQFPQESLLMQQLYNLGYRKFHLEPNFYGIPEVWEIAFIHESLCEPGKVVLERPFPDQLVG